MPISNEMLIRRAESLQGDRLTWESHWQEVSDYVIPNKSDVQRTWHPGQKRNTIKVDSSAIQSNELLAGALHGMLTNPTTQWFNLTSGDEQFDQNDDVRFWLQDSTRRMVRVLNESNFQQQIHEIYLDLASFGTALLVIEEDDDVVVRFKSEPVSRVIIAENHKGQVDEVYRRFKWDSKALIQKFGMDGVPKRVREDFEKKHASTKWDIIHAVYPTVGDEGLPRQFKFASNIIFKKDKITLGEVEGFREFPYAVTRWSKASGEIYGRSPAMNALPDVKMINEMMKTTIRGAQKAVDPPLQAPDDGFILPLTTKPGGFNYYRAGTQDIIRPIFNDTRVEFGFQLMENIRTRIRDAFFIDQLQLTQGPQMTATEVLQRTEERMRLLGPMLGRQQSELLRPLVNRLFNIMMRRRMFLRPPEVIQGLQVGAQYNSVVARAQRSTELQNLERAIGTAAPFIQADPSVLDNVNGDEAFRFIARLTGLPQEIMRPEEQRDEQREARAQAAAQAQQQQQQTVESQNLAAVAPAIQSLSENAG